MAIVGTGPLGFSPNLRHRLEASAPKGLEDSAQGFNPGKPRVSTLGTNQPERRALKGRQIERTSNVKASSNCSTSQLRILIFAAIVSGHPLAPSGRTRLFWGFPGLKPRAESCSPFGAKSPIILLIFAPFSPGFDAPLGRSPSVPRRGKKAQPRVYPGLAENRRSALKGLEIRMRSGSKVRSRFSPYLSAPSGLIPVRGTNPGSTLGYAF
jgi:hypothetical protein